jgi:hypothetical protein
VLRFIPTWRMAARHGQSNWRMLGVLGMGILVAAVLLAAAPIYSRSMADLGLTFTIQEELGDRAGVTVQVANIPLQTEDGRALRESISQRIDERLGWFRAEQSTALELPRVRFAESGEPQGKLAPSLHLLSQRDYEEHVTVVEGALPAPSRPGEPIETAMSPAIAGVLGLSVGDTYDLIEDFDNCERDIPEGDNPPPPPPCDFKAIVKWRNPAVLTALIEPLATDDTFWITGVNRVFEPQRPLAIPDEGPILSIFVDEATVLEGYGGVYPAYYTMVRWNMFADPEVLTRRNFERATADIIGLESEIEGLGGFVYGPLESTLINFGTERQATSRRRSPSCFLRSRPSPSSIPRSLPRPSSNASPMRSRCSARAARAPGRSRPSTCSKASTSLSRSSSSRHSLPPRRQPCSASRRSSTTSQMATCYPSSSRRLVRDGRAWRRARYRSASRSSLVVAARGALAHRRGQSRPGVSFIQRYYLDLIFAGLAGLLLWELNEKGSAFEPSPTGGVSQRPRPPRFACPHHRGRRCASSFAFTR